jgi:YD repeat-containing protein
VNGQYGTFSGNYSAIVHIRDLPSLQQTTDASGNVLAQTTFNYDQYSLASEGGLTQWDSSVPAARGNLTTRSALLQQQSRSLSTVYNYDNAGSVVSVTDPKNNTTTVAYSNAYANAFPTLVTFPLGSQYNVQTSYDFNTGKPTSFTDMNGNVTSYKYADELERLTEVDLPDGGVTTFGYCDAGSNQSCPSGSPTNSVTKTVKQNSCSTGNAVVTDALYDGLGRTTKTHQYENPGAIVVQTLFDGMGRTSSVSNPMRSENPTDVNITAYDSLGRVKSVTAPDGSVTSTTWLGAAMTSADPAGVSKILNYDAFGRLLQVTENPGGSPFFTNYLYDALDDLTGVCQGNSFDSNGNCQSGGIGRRFIYDSLKRLTSATNPESGTIGYSYDDNGNVLTKTDARGWITCYGTYSGSNCANGYDPLNRLTAKTYFNAAAPANTTPAPAITWVWDTVSKGHLSSVSAASTSPSYVSSTQFQSYDPLGRVTQSTQTTNGNNYTFYYAYNLAGALESEIYPSARAVKTCYDSAGRALSVAGTPSSGPTTTYASNMSYAPHGAIQQLSRGDNLTETRSYNNRLQETAISLGTSGNARSAFGQDMYYCSNGAAACTTNNGNLLSLNLPYLSAQQSFSYDAINRLTAAAETSPGTGWSQSYGYDQFGNRWVSGGITTSPFTPIASTNFDANNRLQIQGTQYDASGNLSAIGGYVYQNDSEGRIATVAINGSSTLYGYDGDGRRVFKQTPANTTNYVYDASGELAAEYSTAPQTNPCQTCYLTTDHLGSTRVMTNPAGSAVSQHDYLPFGEEVPLGLRRKSGSSRVSGRQFR